MALLAGASGLVGSCLLDELLARPEYPVVIALARRPLDRSHPKLETRVIDYERLAEETAGLRADHVFCALGTTMRQAGSRERFRVVDLDYPTRLAGLTRQAGARFFGLVSSLGASRKAGTFYLRIKGEVEEAVAACDWPSLTIVRPSVIAGPRQETRVAERVATSLLRFGPRKTRPSPAWAIARALVKAALDERPGTRVIEARALADVSP